MNYEIKEEGVNIIEGEKIIFLTFSEITDISREVDKKIYYSCDLVYFIIDLIRAEKLPKTAIFNLDFLNDLLNKYSDLRMAAECSWNECLEKALMNVNYNDYCYEMTAEELKKAIINNKTDYYNVNTGDYVFCYNEDGAIAVYSNISIDDAVRISSECDTYWADTLGYGGYIYDKPDEYFKNNNSGVWVKAQKAIIDI